MEWDGATAWSTVAADGHPSLDGKALNGKQESMKGAIFDKLNNNNNRQSTKQRHGGNWRASPHGQWHGPLK
jgi:hypothetical protein